MSAKAGQFEKVKDSMVLLEFASGKVCAVAVASEEGTFILASQDVFTSALLSIKDMDGRSMQAISFEAPEEESSILRIKIAPENKKVEIAENMGASGAIFRANPVLGIVSELQVMFESNGIVPYKKEEKKEEKGAKDKKDAKGGGKDNKDAKGGKGKDGKDAKGKDSKNTKSESKEGKEVQQFRSFANDAVGGPVVNGEGMPLGIVATAGYNVKKIDFLSGVSEFLDRKFVVHACRRDMKWEPVDIGKLAKEASLFQDSERFLSSYAEIADAWRAAPYGLIEPKANRHDKLDFWIDDQNKIAAEMPVIRQRIKESFGIRDSMKNVETGKMEKKMELLGRRLSVFSSYYEKGLNPDSKWETAHFRKKAEELSEIFTTLGKSIAEEVPEILKGEVF